VSGVVVDTSEEIVVIELLFVIELGNVVDDVDEVEGAFGTENGDKTGGDGSGGGGGGRGNSKISTTFKYPLLLS
jgi:hypothetical protein